MIFFKQFYSELPNNAESVSVCFMFPCVLWALKVIVTFFRFLVREFVYDEQALEAGKNEITKLESDKKKQFVS